MLFFLYNKSKKVRYFLKNDYLCNQLYIKKRTIKQTSNLKY